MPIQCDLFADDLAREKVESAKRKKNVAWIEGADLLLANSEDQLRALVAEALAAPGPKAVDTETTGLTYDDRIVGVSVAWRKADGNIRAFYVPLYSRIASVGIDPITSLAILKPLVESPCVWYNFKFDYKVFKKVGLQAGLLADVSLMELFPPGGIDDIEFDHKKNSGLKKRFKEIFDMDMLELSDVLGKGAFDFSLAPLDLARAYASVDVYATLMLYEKYLPNISPEDFIYDLENKVMPVVGDMEYQGIRVDLDLAKKAEAEIQSENAILEAKIYELAGEKFNIGSPQELVRVLYDKLQLPVLKFIKDPKTKKPTTKPSTDKEALSRLKGKHDIIEPLMEFKSNLKLLTAFVSKLPDFVGSDGNIHTNYRPYGTISGRFTSVEPNLQQLPKGDDDESNKAFIRKCFVARPGYYFVDCDYSQVEYRILASRSKDPALIEAFADDSTDFHQSTASIMFGIPYSEVTSAERKKGKILNFGLAYGLSVPSLANILKVTVEEAEELYNLYFQKMPMVQSWIRRTHEDILRTQLSASYYGRIRRLPAAASEEMKERSRAQREGLNHEIQSTSGEITKIAMVRCGKVIKGTGVHILLQVHDELLFEVPDSIPPGDIIPKILNAMQLPLKDFVKLKVDASIGRNWGSCIDYVEGMTLADIPEPEKFKSFREVVISGDFVANKDSLKKMFEQFVGDVPVKLSVDGVFIEPQRVDQETGEYLSVAIQATEASFSALRSLGLTVSGVE